MPSIDAHVEPTRTMSRGARWIIIIVALFGGIAPWFADYNDTHIFNPRWPPHAVFHDGQVLVLASASNILALVFLPRGPRQRL